MRQCFTLGHHFLITFSNISRGIFMEEKLKEIFSSFKGQERELIPLLQHVQNEYGYIPENTMLEIARFTRTPESQVYSIATFYGQFRFTPKGRRHVMVCRGTACHVRGAPRIREEIEKIIGIKEGETSPDLEYSLETVACIGACGLAPNMMVNEVTYGRLTNKKLHEIFRTEEKGGSDEE
jgi:NADH:ubiquinone oxidoreductase subunit E